MNSLYFAVKNSMQGAPIAKAPGVWEASFLFDAAFIGFNGHFPGDPMLPGIAQLMAAMLTAAPDAQARLLQIGRSKFLQMVRPGSTLHILAKTSRTEGVILAAADCATENGLCSQLKFTLESTPCA